MTVTVPAYNGVILTDKGHVKQVSVDEENLKPGFDPAYKIKSEERAVKVTGVSLKKTEITLQKGKTANISKNVVVAPQNATNTAVKYKTSDKTVASVDKDGNVTANAKGTATITVTTKDGLFTSECKVTVGDQVQAAKIKLNKTKLSLKKGKTYTLKATVTPKDCTDKAVKWKSSKSSVVKVDANGKVTAKKAGTATITAATKNGLKATCKITVTDPATKVYLTPAMSIKKGSSVKLTASVFSDYPKWIAQHSNKCTYQGSYHMWQYSTQGVIPGISEKVDLNYKIGNWTYAGYSSAKKTVVVKPKATTIKSLRKSGKKAVKITYKKVSGVSGYQIYMSTKKKSGYKKIATLSSKKSSYTKGKLKKGKKYYFKVRTMKKVSGKYRYSSFSKVRSIKR